MPVDPFFLKVYDGQQAETETIKDMQVMETNQATEASSSTNRVIRIGEDVKTRRKKLTFSMDDVMQTRQFKAQEVNRREAEAKTKKKGNAIIISLVIALLLVFGIIILVFKSKQADKPVNDPVVNQAPDFIKETVEVLTQEKGKILEMGVDKAKLPGEAKIDETSGLVIGWNKQTTSLEWTAQIKEKGWYELFVDYAKSDAEADVRLKMGFTDFNFKIPPTAEGKLEKKSFGYFETSNIGRMNIALVALRPGPDSVAAVKAVRLKFHGDKKPNPFGELADETFEDFDSPYFNNEWLIKGEAFTERPLSKSHVSPYFEINGVSGDYCAGSIVPEGETKNAISELTGVMISREFTIKHRYIHMLARGGDKGKTKVSLLINNSETLSKAAPHNWPIRLSPLQLNVEDFIGQKGRLVFRDTGETVLVFDRIVFSNNEIDILNVGSTKLEKERPEIFENKDALKYADAGKKFVSGDFNATVAALAAGPSKDKKTEGLDTSAFNEEILKFDNMTMRSKKELKQIPESGNVYSDGCGDKDVISLTGSVKKSQDMNFLQVLFRADNGKKVGFSGNGNIFMTNFNFKVERPEILNKGRYVRVSLLYKSEYLSLAEVQVMSGGKNVALKKPASQSSVDNEGDASRAVDGNTDGVYANNSVTHTKLEQSPWWEVDLGSEVAIDQINVFSRAEDLVSRLNRYTVTILDEKRRIIWQAFKKEAQIENSHKVDKDFMVSFDKFEYTFTNKDRHPIHTLFSDDNESGWSVYGQQNKSQTLWYGSSFPVVINKEDKLTTKMFFESKNKKHVPRKVNVAVLSEDTEKLAQFKEKLKPFFNFEQTIIDTFKEDLNKFVDFTAKGDNKVYNIKIDGIVDGNKIKVSVKKNSVILSFSHMSDAEIKKRAERIENGLLAYAVYKNEFAETVKTFEATKDSLVEKLISSGSKEVVAKSDPMVLTGRYIEFWTRAEEGKPKFDILVTSAGTEIRLKPKTVPLSEMYADYGENDYKVHRFDLGVQRNINNIKTIKTSEGQIFTYSLLIKNDQDETIWQNTWQGANLLTKDRSFGLKASFRYKTPVNLAKGASIIKGAAKDKWTGLTDGIYGSEAPFAYATEEGDMPREIIIDLGGMKTVNAFRAVKSPTSAFNGISVEYSADNQTYTSLIPTSTDNNTRDSVLWTIPDSEIRYVKIRFLVNSKTFSKAEFKNLSILSEFEVLKF